MAVTWEMSWRRVLGKAWLVIIMVTLLVGLPLLIWDMHRLEFEPHVISWFVSGIFVLLAIPISLWEVLLHLHNYSNPKVQRHVIRIIWMVPIYALNSWFALRFKGASLYIDTMRECYEAYVIYNFTFFLINVLAGPHDEAWLQRELENKPPMTHIFPFNFLPPWRMGRQFLDRCKHGVLSYTVVRLITAALTLLLQGVGAYGEGEMSNFGKGYIWITLINNFSQVWAMYCLILLYQNTKEELAPIKPMGKFLCVKAVVFFSFWQSVLIAALVHYDVITESEDWTSYDVEDVSTGLQDFLVCIEMFFASIAHLYVFSHRDFLAEGTEPMALRDVLRTVFDISDVKHDVKFHVTKVVRKGQYITKLRAPKQRPALGELDGEAVGQEPLLHAVAYDSADVGGEFEQIEAEMTDLAVVNGESFDP